jgi:hypothetical protein
MHTYTQASGQAFTIIPPEERRRKEAREHKRLPHLNSFIHSLDTSYIFNV